MILASKVEPLTRELLAPQGTGSASNRHERGLQTEKSD